MRVIKVTANLPTTKDNWAKYHFDDGSVVKVVYSPEFGESQPDGPCSPEQQAAIFAYLEERV